jgi:hypothetical protein
MITEHGAIGGIIIGRADRVLEENVTEYHFVRFEVFTAVTMKKAVSWNVAV